MAKKKKHRNKSRKQRNRAAQTTQSGAALNTKPKTAVKTTTAKSKPKITATASENIYDDVELSYVKADIRKTLILVGCILAVYAVLWILMTYTSFGNTSLNLIGR